LNTRLFLFILLFSALGVNLYSQHSVSKEYTFTQHLINQKEFDGALKYLDHIKVDSSNTDTLSSLKGWICYNARYLDSAAMYFDKVRAESGLHLKSSYFSALSYAYQNKIEKALLVLKQVNDTSIQFKNFQLACVSLLNRDTASYAASLEIMDVQNNLFMEKAALQNIHHQILTQKSKSPLLAALLSTVIPGSGKIYAGFLGKGLAALLQVGSLAAVTAEHFYWSGASPQFYIFGTLTSIFYFGNIWGSALAVQIRNSEKNNEWNSEILTLMHTSMRRTFL